MIDYDPTHVVLFSCPKENRQCRRPPVAAHPVRCRRRPEVDRFRAQHLSLASGTVADRARPPERARSTSRKARSPGSRAGAGRDGQALIAPHQLQAGERLRADFTRRAFDAAHHHRIGRARCRPAAAMAAARVDATETMVAARQRVHRALDAVGPEFSGLLLDVCCFPKGLEDIERERLWPARSAKIVLQLGARSPCAALRLRRASARPRAGRGADVGGGCGV